MTAIKAADEPFAALADYSAAPGWRKGLADLASLFTAISDVSLAPFELFEIVNEYYRPIFERIYYDDYPKRSRDIEQLKTIIAGYDRLADFVEDTTLEPPESVVVEDDTDRLVLSTVHSAKGLEWDTVFVISLAEGKFPVSQALPGEQMEEERRLFYVAATRAKKRLFMTYPREVMSVDRQFSRARLSPFLAEISAGLYVSSGRLSGRVGAAGSDAAGYSYAAPRRRARRPVAGGSLARGSGRIQDTAVIAPGQAVKHPFFGQGTVDKVTGERTVVVAFDRHGKKTLHLDYAKLEKV
jgi:DNA helicase-2/ATP-dependent DNA helicase PcrA